MQLSTVLGLLARYYLLIVGDGSLPSGLLVIGSFVTGVRQDVRFCFRGWERRSIFVTCPTTVVGIARRCAVHMPVTSVVGAVVAVWHGVLLNVGRASQRP